MKRALIIGAGNIGRGVVGYLLKEAGYQLSFYDLNTEALETMQQNGGYSVFVADGETSERHEINTFEIIPPDRLTEALIDHEFVFCCVYEGAFQSIANHLAEALRQKMKLMNIMLCVNSLGAPQKFRAFVEDALDEDKKIDFQKTVGINQVMVLSAGLPLSEAQLEKYPYAVMITANPHLEIDGLSFKGEQPQIPQVAFVSNAEGRIYRKVYVGNMRHVMAGFIGDAQHMTFVCEAQQDSKIRSYLIGAFEEAHEAISAKYTFDPVEDQEWVAYMQEKLTQNVKDPIQRVTANPAVKLGAEERFIGPAKLCLAYNILPFYITLGVAYGLRYLQKEDQRTVDQLLIEVCGLDPQQDFILYQLIKKHYQGIEGEEDEI
ncbi:2-dehydropantoate 2-reductase N-terminal domain-containing protein [Enterococcus pallens]|uniref:Mannitol dehydrogenase n=1 Tax=Enterococcus pallens ATCC BAA-351 TaxID=1158607 RepID=R2TBD2_9ENTE|nr:2-dehydropantoate 2-reductase N-terminal domain-containing protein [Enterococcus pallens]EOH97504.1 hypothetical protein UAU_00172 [Enterococcus pallens ATCC BAA-351]EOU21077.1 hypothetical protein I588_01924 [Enterococcus pallens ATCC BAA-351]OJG77789.1 hypothetical protein RV10_GL002182 [Enterococcus pallens]